MNDVLLAAVIGSATAIAGLLTGILSRIVRKRHASEKIDANRVLSTYRNVAESRKLRATEEIVKEVSKRSSDKSLERRVRQVLDSLDLEESDYRNELRIIEELITGYHEQALQQSKVQFWFSVIAATVGLGLIFYMILSAVNLTTLETILRSLPGVAIEAVAGLFFTQAHEIRKRATELFDRLRIDKQQTKAIAIANTIEDTTLRSTVIAQISLHMSGLTRVTADPNKIISDALFDRRMNSEEISGSLSDSK